MDWRHTTTGTAEQTAPAKKEAPTARGARGAKGLATDEASCPPTSRLCPASEPSKREPFGRPNETAAYQGAMSFDQRVMVVCEAAPLTSTLLGVYPYPPTLPMRLSSLYSKAEAPKRSPAWGFYFGSRGASIRPAPRLIHLNQFRRFRCGPAAVAIPATPEIRLRRNNGRYGPILLKKSEYRLGPIFSAPWVRFSNADGGGSHHPPQTQRNEF